MRFDLYYYSITGTTALIKWTVTIVIFTRFGVAALITLAVSSPLINTSRGTLFRAPRPMPCSRGDHSRRSSFAAQPQVRAQRVPSNKQLPQCLPRSSPTTVAGRLMTAASTGMHCLQLRWCKGWKPMRRRGLLSRRLLAG